jgi:glycosyltransferase involved in cell wall biosynthesis
VLFLAAKNRNCSFTIIGISDSVVSQLGPVPANVTIHPYLPQEQFRSFLAGSQYVLQLSLSEGFPNALCEAMLCNCIPVGSSVGAIPYIIGDTGYVFTSSAKDYLRSRFDEIMHTDSSTRVEMGLRARKRIAENFNISKRENAFFDLLEGSR